MRRRVSRAKAREQARQRKFFEDDIEQPFVRGKPNRRFEKLYGKETMREIRQQRRYKNQKNYELDYE